MLSAGIVRQAGKLRFFSSDADILPRVPWWRPVSMSGFGSVFSIGLPGNSVVFLRLSRVLLDVKVGKLLCGVISSSVRCGVHLFSLSCAYGDLWTV